MTKIILIATLVSLALVSQGQDFVDNALLFSRARPAGSARIQAMGGAQVSLGGDYSSALSNPAGLGMFNRSEFTITPGLTFNNATSDYFGTSSKDSKSVFNLPGISIVLNRPSERTGSYIGGSFAVSLSRTNDFNQDYKISGTNNENSIVDYFIEDAAGTDPEDFLFNGSDFYSLTGLAYNNYLIEDYLDDNNNIIYDSKLLFNSGTQEEISQRKGSQYQWSLAYGGNFSDRFFFGATVGIATLRYKINQVYQESDLVYPAGADVALNEFAIIEDYDIRGSGVNFAIGAIARPVDFLQIGVSFVTPTYYTISDTYTARIESQWNNYDYYPDDTEDDRLNSVSEEFDVPLVSDYNFSTPMRLSTGVSFISEHGLVSADVEFVNYAKAKYKSDIAGDFEFENDDIQSEYKSTVNYRIGGEFRSGSYRARAGFNYMTDPLTGEGNADRSIISYTGGLGYRLKQFYIDLAAVYSTTNGRRVPYFVNGPDPVADQEFRSMNYLMTLGFTF